MLVNDDNRDYYLQTMAKHYGKKISDLKKQVEKRPEILEGWAEHLQNDFEDESQRSFKHYGAKYYE